MILMIVLAKLWPVMKASRTFSLVHWKEDFVYYSGRSGLKLCAFLVFIAHYLNVASFCCCSCGAVLIESESD